MARRDWLILCGLLAAAFWAGWPRLRETQLGRYLAGEQEWRGRRSLDGCWQWDRSDGPCP